MHGEILFDTLSSAYSLSRSSWNGETVKYTLYGFGGVSKMEILLIFQLHQDHIICGQSLLFKAGQIISSVLHVVIFGGCTNQE